ncbi:uncharacterized protein F4807DRAFT_465411 [Annulohypoxylon truncatum]|uniref:uncharacterized protein n=1 Tax=Annulohypoxylon truncatum TaxID=327061 RepID=UPI002007294D|nr:uncharacterized protein F4807DRAFT_465411 [Annulohypoxylon truncatum]KAI1204636.1 hypothetical protein F4807DRAFT_465411 [Annulohypoxylon truncatum]
MEVMRVWASHDRGTRSDEPGEEIQRRFNPRCISFGSRIPADHRIVYDQQKKASQLECKHSTCDVEPEKTIVVSIDGACHRKGSRPPRATWAVSFGIKSPHSASGLLCSSFPQTATFAKIEALSQALRIIQREFADDPAQGFFIRTDLDIHVGEMSEWIEDWLMRMGNPLRTIQFPKTCGDDDVWIPSSDMLHE